MVLRTGKNEIILTCPCAKRLHSARLKTEVTMIAMLFLANGLFIKSKLQ